MLQNVYFDVLNHLGVTRECDGQTDRQTDKLIALCRASLCWAAEKLTIMYLQS